MKYMNPTLVGLPVAALLLCGLIFGPAWASEFTNECRDCHAPGSGIVPEEKQFGLGTVWHIDHQEIADGDCSKCHAWLSDPPPTGIGPEGNGCGNCHDESCAWQEEHEGNRVYLDNVVGLTCAGCHRWCMLGSCFPAGWFPEDWDAYRCCSRYAVFDLGHPNPWAAARCASTEEVAAFTEEGRCCFRHWFVPEEWSPFFCGD